ncbi:MAG: ABC transporter ATP-binding protein [Spirochaetia bacterium]|jgi:putative ABC transport system ATP-binding protein|nr:ABC transporter ATP-binding protein [Spirochaetia bacterium]
MPEINRDITVMDLNNREVKTDISRGSSGPAAELKGVWKIYHLGKTEVPAVRGVDLSIRTGDFATIAGPSGSGKSTLLNLLGCIDVPSRGSVKVAGQETSTLSDRQITSLRHRSIGFIFQSFNLMPVLNIQENVELPLLLGGKAPPKKERREYINFLIEQVGLSDWRKHRPGELSGGQRQRVAIARALATRPKIVLADEPTANLDSKTGTAIIELMKRINAELSTTFIFSTHDSTIVDIADHIIYLHDGEVTDEMRK